LWRISFGVAAEGLMIAPPGQRLPRRTAIPERLGERKDHVAVVAGRFAVVLPDRFPIDRQCVPVEQVAFAQLAQHRGQPAGVVEIFH